MRRHHINRLATGISVTLAAAAVAAPGAAAQPPDGVSSSDTARQAGAVVVQSPDAQALNRQAGERAAQSLDKVTPDARDSADGRKIVVPPRPQIVVQRVSAGGGMDWGDVAIGAAGTLGLVLVASGAALTVTRHRAHVRPV